MLTVVQLLIINLAMDTLVAIAFGSEVPHEEYMNDKPVQRSARMVTGQMTCQILASSLYICIISLLILFSPSVRDIFGSVSDTYLRSALFAFFRRFGANFLSFVS